MIYKLHAVFLVFLIFFTLSGKENKQNTQKITITNTITRKNAGKTKFFMHHYPEKFALQVNGIPIQGNETKEIPITNKHFNIQYSYTWHAPWSKITGTKKVHYKLIDKNKKYITLHFTSWDDEYRINAPGAQALKVEVIASSGDRTQSNKNNKKLKKRNRKNRK